MTDTMDMDPVSEAPAASVPPSPQPLVRRRTAPKFNSNDTDDIMDILKAQIGQEGIIRE